MKPTLRTSALCLLCSIVLPLGNISAQTVLYGTTGAGSNPGKLYTIDPATGIATAVGPLVDSGAAHYAVTSLAFDATGTLYGATSMLSPTAASELVRINPTSGLVTVVGAFGSGVNMGDLTFNSVNSTLYGTNSLSADLYSINVSSGAATLVGASGVAPTPTPSGMGVAANGSGTVFGTPKSAAGNLFTYNTSTGVATAGPALTAGPFGANGSINALAFNPSSILFGVDLNRGDGTRPSDLITINTATGAVTNIGSIVDSGTLQNISNMDAIVFSAVVPEPATWVGSALVFGYLCFVLLRRRKLAAA